MEFGSIYAHAGYLFIVMCGFAVSFLLVGPSRMFDPRRIGCIYYAFMFVTYGFRPFLEMIIFRDSSFLAHLNDNYEPVTFTDVTVIVFGCIVAITLVVFGFVYSRLTHTKLEHLHIGNKYPMKRFVRYGYWALFAMGYFGFLIASRGGGAMLRSDVGSGFVGTSGYMFLLNYMVAGACICRAAVTGKVLTSALLGLPWAAVHIMNGFNRYIIITWIIGLGIIWLSRRRAIPIKKLIPIIIALPVILFVFNILNYNRKAFTSMEGLDQAVENVLETPLNRYFNGFAGYEGGLITLDRMNRGYDFPKYGTVLIYKTIIWPVPRMLWRSKPYPAYFTWRYILSFGQNYELDYNFASVFHRFFVRGGVGSDLMEWGRYLFWINALLLGLLAGFVERKCLVPGGHPILFALYGVFYASFIYIGRNTIYNNIGPYLFALYSPMLAIYFYTAYFRGYRQPKLRAK